MISCDWEGNRKTGVALAMRHRFQWFIHLQAHGLRKEDQHPAYSPFYLFTLFDASLQLRCFSLTFKEYNNTLQTLRGHLETCTEHAELSEESVLVVKVLQQLRAPALRVVCEPRPPRRTLGDQSDEGTPFACAGTPSAEWQPR